MWHISTSLDSRQPNRPKFSSVETALPSGFWILLRGNSKAAESHLFQPHQKLAVHGDSRPKICFRHRCIKLSLETHWTSHPEVRSATSPHPPPSLGCRPRSNSFLFSPQSWGGLAGSYLRFPTVDDRICLFSRRLQMGTSSVPERVSEVGTESSR